MATRSIVTSQPDVACDVCERRLLRGEQPDLFLAAGQPRTVCELCAPRAAHQGWKRGSEQHTASAEPISSRRGRRLLGRLRQSRRPDERDVAGVYDAAAPALDAERPYDALGDDVVAEQPHGRGGGLAAPVRAGAPVDRPAEQTPAPVADGPLQRALDAFNAGEYTRRVASLTRSLGAPEVTVRPGEAVASCVVIVLAWELCWYAYEVDLDDRSKLGQQSIDVRAIAQGTELSELGPDDRLANALADERGALALR
ncbi:MAG TPA: hypothetical protein VK707_01870 [Solirubrobacteraceae bacterium]|jgi:hypothetical protein|nr:hypothetical protein [Solirubrobacteraceae bacterium]